MKKIANIQVEVYQYKEYIVTVKYNKTKHTAITYIHKDGYNVDFGVCGSYVSGRQSYERYIKILEDHLDKYIEDFKNTYEKEEYAV